MKEIECPYCKKLVLPILICSKCGKSLVVHMITTSYEWWKSLSEKEKTDLIWKHNMSEVNPTTISVVWKKEL